MKKDLTCEIVVASEAGELEKVKSLLKEGASPNAMGPNSGAIHVAAFNGYKSVVEVLLKAGANPNLADKQQFYPLHLAASKGHSSICKVLVQSGAKMDVKTADGGSALHVAAASGFDKVVSMLIYLAGHLCVTKQTWEDTFEWRNYFLKKERIKALKAQIIMELEKNKLLLLK